MGGTSGGGSLEGIGDAIGPVFNAPTIDSTGILGTFLDGDTLFAFTLDIAKQNGTAKVLAEPNLTALSGAKAEFLAGGSSRFPFLTIMASRLSTKSMVSGSNLSQRF